jgi:transposase, IS30 family
MLKTYQHLTKNERDLIAVLKGEGRSLRDIAKAIGRNPSTVSRELKRNAPKIYQGYYLAHRAHERSQERNRQSRTHPKLKNEQVRSKVRRKLQEGWSPEIISGWLRLNHPNLYVSHESIYQWVYADARELIPLLVRSHKRRKRKGHSKRHKALHVPERVSIRKRPKHIEHRRQCGHWEADTMISRSSSVAIQVVTERKSRLTKLNKLKRKVAREMSSSLNRKLSRVPQNLRLTITYDNGPENHEHARTNRVLGTRSYFCEPYHSYERGTVENTIGLVRRFLPKKTDFSKISKSEIRLIEQWLNNRPRKCLGFKTPAEVFQTAGVALTG